MLVLFAYNLVYCILELLLCTMRFLLLMLLPNFVLLQDDSVGSVAVASSCLYVSNPEAHHDAKFHQSSPLEKRFEHSIWSDSNIYRKWNTGAYFQTILIWSNSFFLPRVILINIFTFDHSAAEMWKGMVCLMIQTNELKEEVLLKIQQLYLF